MIQRFFPLTFSDISYEKQLELITEVKKSLLEICELEGKNFLTRKWYVAPKTWEEAYCRVYDIYYTLWNDLGEDSDEFQSMNWEMFVDERVEEEAIKKCSKGASNLQLKVEIDS